MPKTITVVWYGTTPESYKGVEDFVRLDETTIKFKSVTTVSGKTVTKYITTNFPYFYEDLFEHSGKIAI